MTSSLTSSKLATFDSAPISGQEEKLRCAFCGGSKCKRCGELAYTTMENPAIEKLHSTWITESILAMQRPSDFLFDNAGLLDLFSTNNITAVFNLTEAGEHPYCGFGIIESCGFPYSPEKLMKVGIKHFNYSWADMTVPSLVLMKNIVNVAISELSTGGKIAVHCHAGYGRTGIAIACILIAQKGLTSEQAVTLVRLRRPGSIQTQKQEKFVFEFEEDRQKTMFVICRELKSGSVNRVKSILASIHDLSFLLQQSELTSNPILRWVHKVVVSVATAVSCGFGSDPLLTLECFTGLRRETIGELPLGTPVSPSSSSLTDLQTRNGAQIEDTGWIPTDYLNPSLYQRMIGDINSNKWGIFNTAADILKHANIRMGLLRSSSGLVDAGGMNVNEVSSGTGTGTGTPAARLRHNSEISSCCSSLIQVFFDWFDSRTDFVFSFSSVQALEDLWKPILLEHTGDAGLQRNYSMPLSPVKEGGADFLPDIHQRKISTDLSSVSGKIILTAPVSIEKILFSLCSSINALLHSALERYKLRILDVVIKMMVVLGDWSMDTHHFHNTINVAGEVHSSTSARQSIRWASNGFHSRTSSSSLKSVPTDLESVESTESARLDRQETNTINGGEKTVDMVRLFFISCFRMALVFTDREESLNTRIFVNERCVNPTVAIFFDSIPVDLCSRGPMERIRVIESIRFSVCKWVEGLCQAGASRSGTSTGKGGGGGGGLFSRSISDEGKNDLQKPPVSRFRLQLTHSKALPQIKQAQSFQAVDENSATTEVKVPSSNNYFTMSNMEFLDDDFEKYERFINRVFVVLQTLLLLMDCSWSFQRHGKSKKNRS